MSETTFPAEITEIGDKIANLKITEAVLLKNYLKEKYNIEPAAGGVVMQGGGGGGAAVAAKPEEKTEFTVSLDGLAAADKKINVIKVVREITGLGLKEAKDLVDGAPQTVKAGVSKDESAQLKAKLEAEGAVVEIK